LDEAVRVLKSLASTLMNALETVRRRERSEQMLKAFQAITAPSKLEETLNQTIKAVPEIAEGVATATIWYVDSDNPNHLFFKNWGCFPELVDIYKPASDSSIQRENAQYISSILANPTPEAQFLSDAQQQQTYSEYVTRYRIVSTAHLPLVVKEEGEIPKTVGVMFLNFLNPQKFPLEERELYKTLANIVATNIRDATRASDLIRTTLIASHLVPMNIIAHDLGSSIFRMETDVVMLEKSEISSQLIEHVKAIGRELDRIKDGLPVMRGKRDNNLYAVELDEIKSILESLSEKQAQIKVHYCVAENIKIKANRTYLKGIITHFWNNWVKKENEVSEIWIYSSREGVADGKIRIKLADNGIGVSEEIARQMFRGPIRPNRDDQSRSGMGLLHARNIVQSMDATIGYLGKHEGRGTIVGIEINLYQAQEEKEDGELTH
jgi:K+-sensing histidine kinase KdpD